MKQQAAIALLALRCGHQRANGLMNVKRLGALACLDKAIKCDGRNNNQANDDALDIG